MLSSHIRLKGLLVLAMLAAAGVSAQDLHARIDSYLVEQVRTSGILGLTAAAVRDGTVIYIGAFGVRQLGSDEVLTPEHVFHFASVSKPFVATAIMQLMERNKLTLDDPVTKFLPYFRLPDERVREITIRQMLNHTSGMPDVEDYAWDRPLARPASSGAVAREESPEASRSSLRVLLDLLDKSSMRSSSLPARDRTANTRGRNSSYSRST